MEFEENKDNTTKILANILAATLLMLSIAVITFFIVYDFDDKESKEEDIILFN